METTQTYTRLVHVNADNEMTCVYCTDNLDLNAVTLEVYTYTPEVDEFPGFCVVCERSIHECTEEA